MRINEEELDLRTFPEAFFSFLDPATLFCKARAEL